MNYTKVYWIVIAILSLSAILLPVDYFRSTYVSNRELVLDENQTNSFETA